VLREAAIEASGLAPWLFEECYQAGRRLRRDACARAAAGERVSDRGLAEWVARLAALRGADPADGEGALIADWDELDWNGRFLLIKLIGGGFRVGVSRLLVTRALAAHAGLDAKTVAQRLIGYTHINAQHDADAFAP
jgi:DNA ligase-1